MKRIIIAHRWGGTPDSDWYPWIAKELEKKDFEVIVPELPDTEHPRIETWVPALSKAIGKADKDTFLIGHSMGCQAIMRYLSTLKGQIGGTLLVAGFLMLELDESAPLDVQVAKPWAVTPFAYENVKKASPNLVAMFSDNDPYVPPVNAQLFNDKIGAKVILEKGMMHYNGDEEPTVLKTFLKEILKK